MYSKLNPTTAWPGSNKQRATNTHQINAIIFRILGILLIVFFPVKKKEEKSNDDTYPLWWFDNLLKLKVK